jgi:hypothetical protein
VSNVGGVDAIGLSGDLAQQEASATHKREVMEELESKQS